MEIKEKEGKFEKNKKRRGENGEDEEGKRVVGVK